MQSSATTLIIAFSIVVMCSCPSGSVANPAFGLNFHQSMTDLGDVEGFNSSALGLLVAFPFGPPVINFEIGLEFIPKYFTGDGVMQTSLFVMTGRFVYGGIGTGIGLGGNANQYSSVPAQQSPFIALRAGIKLTKFDLFTSYRWQTYNSGAGYTVENDDLDSLTFGGLYRF